ncbi:MAG: hypothetical protein QF464_22640, partial [Myxococcota bacterium]|nr:hypothetical protein [Myxococcota bacterium]
DLDDIATFIELAMNQFDIAALVPHQIKTSGGSNPSVGPCEYEVKTYNVSASFGGVDLDPVHGGLEARINFVNLYSDVGVTSGQWLCPNVSGDVSISSITVTARLNLQVTGGAMSVSLASVDANVHGLDVDIDGIVGGLFNFIVDFFEDDFAEYVEEAIESEIPDLIVPMLGDILTDLGTYGSSFEINPGVNMQITTGLEGARFLPSGLDLTMAFGAGVDKQITAESPGSLAWTGCQAGAPVSGDAIGTGEGTIGTGTGLLPHASALEAYFREDVANQLMFAAWWGGATTVPVPVVDQAGAGLDNVVASVDLLLPPVVTGCTQSGHLEIQLGDLQMYTTFEFLGAPGVFEAYLSAWLDVELAVIDVPGSGPALGVGGMTI